jgi:hypothetical protein
MRKYPLLVPKELSISIPIEAPLFVAAMILLYLIVVQYYLASYTAPLFETFNWSKARLCGTFKLGRYGMYTRE